MSNVEMLPVIAGTVITTDDQGRFNLNALHKASGLGKQKQPSNWLRLVGTKELLDELSNSSDLRSNVVSSVEGKNGGTFAHELLAVSYAGWISPAFQLKVNQTFLDYRQGKLPAPAVPAAEPRRANSFEDDLDRFNEQLQRLVPILKFKKEQPELFAEANEIISMHGGLNMTASMGAVSLPPSLTVKTADELAARMCRKVENIKPLINEQVAKYVVTFMHSDVCSEFDQWSLPDISRAAINVPGEQLTAQETATIRTCLAQLGWRQRKTYNYRGEGEKVERMTYWRPNSY